MDKLEKSIEFNFYRSQYKEKGIDFDLYKEPNSNTFMTVTKGEAKSLIENNNSPLEPSMIIQFFNQRHLDSGLYKFSDFASCELYDISKFSTGIDRAQIGLFKEMTSYLEVNLNDSKRDKISNTKSNQLTLNQCVVLLDRLGIFESEDLKNETKVKQSKLISKLLGLNEKNIKSAIENLTKSRSQSTAQQLKDNEIVQGLLE